ncbi:hypothetical protein C8R47DRAFT_1329826 [Mycena vitilis]|nr:hypothetical protein C8R47DRAFT_1329826 [Mycena vitilis]
MNARPSIAFDLVLRVAIADARCAKLILRWVDEYAPEAHQLFPPESDIGLFSNLPSELLSVVINLLTIRARVRFAQTCRELHVYAAHLVEQDCRSLMTRFGPPFARIRFLLVASPTLVAGAAIPWLIFPQSRPDIRTLDFYTSAGNVRFGSTHLRFASAPTSDFRSDDLGSLSLGAPVRSGDFISDPTYLRHHSALVSGLGSASAPAPVRIIHHFLSSLLFFTQPEARQSHTLNLPVFGSDLGRMSDSADGFGLVPLGIIFAPSVLPPSLPLAAANITVTPDIPHLPPTSG